MAEGSKVPSPASLCHYQHTVPEGQEATTTQDTLLPGLKYHFLGLSTLIHHKRKTPPQMLLPGLTPAHSPGTPTQSQGQRPLAIQEQGKGSAVHTSVAAPRPVGGKGQSPGGAAVPSPHVCPALGQAEAVAVEMDPIGHSIG